MRTRGPMPLLLAVLLCCATPLWPQTPEQPPQEQQPPPAETPEGQVEEEITVVGIAEALQEAVQIKREEAAIVDAIREAKRRHTSSWSAARTLTHHFVAVEIRAQEPESFVGRNATSGGSSETEVKEPTTIPAGRPSSAIAVTTATPVG